MLVQPFSIVLWLPDGRPIALDRDQLSRALARGAELLGNREQPAAATDETLLDATEAAAVLRVSKATVLRLARQGELPVVGLGRFRKFRRSDLLAGLRTVNS